MHHTSAYTFFHSSTHTMHTYAHYNTCTGNSPPNITGSFLLYVNTGESVYEMYNADDPDGDTINTFILKVKSRNSYCYVAT